MSNTKKVLSTIAGIAALSFAGKVSADEVVTEQPTAPEAAQPAVSEVAEQPAVVQEATEVVANDISNDVSQTEVVAATTPEVANTQTVTSNDVVPEQPAAAVTEAPVTPADTAPVAEPTTQAVTEAPAQTQSKPVTDQPTPEDATVNVDVTKVEVDTGKKNEAGEDATTSYSASEVKIEFSVPDEAKSGDVSYIQLGDSFKFTTTEDTDIPLVTESGATFATATYQPKENRVRLLFADAISDLVDVSGGIKMRVQLASVPDTNLGYVPITISVNGKVKFTKEVDYIGVGEDAAFDMEKSSWQTSDGKSIQTSITIGQTGNTFNKMVIVDKIAEQSVDNVRYNPDSFVVQYGTWRWDDKYGYILDDAKTGQYVLTFSEDKNSFTLHLGDEYNGKGVAIRYLSDYISPVEDGETINNHAEMEAKDTWKREFDSYAWISNLSGWINGSNKPIVPPEDKPILPPAPVHDKPVVNIPSEPKNETPKNPAPKSDKPTVKLAVKHSVGDVVNIPEQQYTGYGVEAVRLPETGEKSNLNYYIVGGALLLAVVSLGFSEAKHKKEHEE